MREFVALTDGCIRCNDRGPFLAVYHHIKDGVVVRSDKPWGFECFICHRSWPAREQDKTDLEDVYGR